MADGAIEASRAAERAARLSYGRILAYLAREWRDLATAEDALSEALRTALETWPVRGVPANPDAWLMVAARNRLADRARSARVRGEAAATLALAATEEADAPDVPDRRLALMAVCAHPDVPSAIQTPLMLQVVLGLDAARIASAFLVKPATMGQRLSRAKETIRAAGVRFELPDREDLAARSEAIREAIYAAYGTGWDGIDGTDARRAGLTQEAIWLARVLAELTPDDPESRGLLALMLHAEARRVARRGADGGYVPLLDQDTGLWNRDMIFEAERELSVAARAGRPGRFQIEAAIQSAHVYGRTTGTSPATMILKLYDALIGFAPTLGNQLGRIAALADAAGPPIALEALDALAGDRLRNHQPFHALRGDLLLRAGNSQAAAAELRHAAGLSDDPAVRAFLMAKAAGL